MDTLSLSNVALQGFVESELHREFKPWPPATWTFDMLTMAALYYHPALELARKQLAVAEGGKLTAAQRPNPTLNITPGYNFTTITPSPWLPLGSIDIPVETAGKRRYRREQASHLGEAARQAVLATAWQVRSELRAALLSFSSAEARRSLLRGQIQLREQLLERLEQQIRAGAVAGSDALSLRVALSKARLDYAENQRQQVEARARVAAAVGVPVRALGQVHLVYDPPIDEGRVAQFSSAEVRRLALTSRADILGALAEYAAAESALQLEVARQYPDVHLAPGYEFDQGDSKWSLGLSMTLPVLNQNQGPIAEAKARRAETAARFNLLQARVLSEIDREIDVLRMAGKNASMLGDVTGEQRRKRDAVAAELRAGAADRLDLLKEELELAAVELAQFEGEVKVREALGNLEDAVQRPFEMPSSVVTREGPHAF